MNNDGVYDVIFVNSYYTMNVSYVQNDEYEIIINDSQTGKSLEITKDDNTVLTEGEDKKEFSSSIAPGDIISVSVGRGEVNIYNFNICNKVITDTPVSKNENKITSSKAEYTLSNTLLKSRAIDQMSLNNEYCLMFDHKGVLAGFKAVSDEQPLDKYFYVFRLKQEENEENSFIIKGATLKGEIKSLTSSDKLRIDDTKLTSDNLYFYADLIENNLVEIKMNEIGEVNKIILPSDEPVDNGLYNAIGINNSRVDSFKYKNGPKVFYKDNVGNVSISANTVILRVPHENVVNKGASLEDYCKVESASNYINDTSYYIKAFCINKNSVSADIIIHYDNDENNINMYSQIMVVGKSDMVAVNKSDLTAQKIKGYYNGKEYEICSANSSFEDESGKAVKLSAGDIIQMDIDNFGDCKTVKMLYDHDAEYVDVLSSFSTGIRVIRGSVYNCDNSVFGMIKNTWKIEKADINPANIEMNLIPGKIIIYDSQEKVLSMGQKSDLVGYSNGGENYSRVVVVSNYSVPTTVVIYK